MKILIIKFRNIGDVLLCTPLIENLYKSYDNAKIDLAINKECESMVTFNPYINQIYSYDRGKVKGQKLLKKLKYEFSYFNQLKKTDYDLIINLTEGDRGALTSLFLSSKIKLGYKPRKGILRHINCFDNYADDFLKIHTIDKDLQFLNLLNKKIINKSVSFYWEKNDEEFVNDIFQKNNIQKFIHVHPVSRWMFKCWENDRMASIIDYFQEEKNIKVVITASPEKKEKDRVDEILSLCRSKPLNLTGKLTLKQLGYLSSKAKLFFGIDSAPMHMAAAVNTPIVALMGGSEAVHWGPWSNEVMENSYKEIDAVQTMGNNTIISNYDHEIFYENNVKKCKGMTKIQIKQIKKILNEKL